MNLSETDLPAEIVVALRKKGIQTLEQLFRKPCRQIKEALPWYYDEITQWITDYRREESKPSMEPRSGAPAGRRDRPQGQVMNSKLTEDEVLAIRKFYGKGHELGDIADEFNISKSSVHRIVNYESWKHLA